MITAEGYSKDPNIVPEGIMLTLPTMFFEDRGMTTEQFKKVFERHMAKDENYWNFRLTNLPTTKEIIWVYLVFDKQVQYRCFFMMYERNKTKEFRDSHDGKIREFEKCNWVIFCGPVEKPPHPWPQKGFQGFRYTTKLW